MGSYDYFIDKCPKCNKEVSVQTKLLECQFRYVMKGEHANLDDMVMLTKDPCECGEDIKVKIHDGKMKGFTQEEATHVELRFGGLEPILKGDRYELKDREVIDEGNPMFTRLVVLLDGKPLGRIKCLKRIEDTIYIEMQLNKDDKNLQIKKVQ